MAELLRVEGLKSGYGEAVVVQGVDLVLEKGRSLALLGRNGTGKTTLSADPDRRLIGDDETIWSDNGLCNLEDGCYAKLIDLSKTAEPVIAAALSKPGTIIENVPALPGNGLAPPSTLIVLVMSMDQRLLAKLNAPVFSVN